MSDDSENVEPNGDGNQLLLDNMLIHGSRSGTDSLQGGEGDGYLLYPNMTASDSVADASSTMVGDEDAARGGDGGVIRDQDRFIPIAVVGKLMKNAIPSTGKISKEGRECVQECVSEFIQFITSEASERCMLEKRKTITAEDVIISMGILGFEQYVDPLTRYMTKYRDWQRSERTSVANISTMRSAVGSSSSNYFLSDVPMETASASGSEMLLNDVVHHNLKLVQQNH